MALRFMGTVFNVGSSHFEHGLVYINREVVAIFNYREVHLPQKLKFCDCFQLIDNTVGVIHIKMGVYPSSLIRYLDYCRRDSCFLSGYL